MGLKFGVHVLTQGGYPFYVILRNVLTAEKLGFSSIWIGDHFFLQKDYYERLGKDPSKPDKMDAWTVIAALAARTKNVTLGTRVSPLPFYHPPRLAKIVTTVDIISEGRAILGAGTGWYKEEAVTYGLEWNSHKTRFQKMKEALQVMIILWTEPRATYTGKYYAVRNAPFFPKPLQKPHPPVWFGGDSPLILEETAKIGEGWTPENPSLDNFARRMKWIKDRAKEYGRDPTRISFAPGFPCNIDFEGETSEHWIEKIAKFHDNGANHIIVHFTMSPQKTLRCLRAFAEKVIPYFQES